MRREALLHYFRVEVVADDPTGPGSTFNADVRNHAHSQLREFAALVERVSISYQCRCPCRLLAYCSVVEHRQ